MAGFRTHYLFGWKTLQEFLPNSSEDFINQYSMSYQLGQQGPDIFYYYFPAHFFHKKNIGLIMHNQSTMLYFENLMNSRNHFIHKADRAICDSYICGFIGHFTLDTTLHPYIHYRTNPHCKTDDRFYRLGTHVLLESDLDKATLRHYMHLKPSQFSCADTIAVSPHELYVISLLVYRALHKTFPEEHISFFTVRNSFLSTRFINHYIMDRYGLKKKLVRRIDEFIFKHPFFSSIIVSDNVTTYQDCCNLRHRTWKNPWDPSITSQRDVFQLIDTARPVYIKRIHMYSKMTSSIPTAIFKNWLQNIPKDIKSKKNPLHENPSTKAYYEQLNNLLVELSDISYDTALPL